MPFTEDRNLRQLGFGGAEVSDVVRASLQAGRVWTDTYLDGLETAAELQRALVRDTPLQPLSAVLTGQAHLTRQVVEAYLSAGERFLGATRETTERAGEAATHTVKRAGTLVERTAKHQAEVVVGPTDEPLAGYDSMTADQVVAKLPEQPQQTLAKVKAYERAHQGRTTVLDRVESLSGDEPIPGYDELPVPAIRNLLSEGDEKLAKRVRDYERAHKARTGVIEAAERQLEVS